VGWRKNNVRNVRKARDLLLHTYTIKEINKGIPKRNLEKNTLKKLYIK
jgi:hypothetical protein